MRVYERRPTGLSPAVLRSEATRNPGRAAFAGIRAAAGVLLMGCAALPLGALWLVIGIGLVGSTFLFVRSAAAGAIERPSLVLTGTPKWDGVRRTSWSIESDDAAADARRLADGLDVELGDALTAFDEGDQYRGTTRTDALAPDTATPVMIAWGVGHRARLKAAGEAVGVWMRIEPAADAAPRRVTILANAGEAADALTRVAWRTPTS